MDAGKFLRWPARTNSTALSRRVLSLPKSNIGATSSKAFPSIADEGLSDNTLVRAGSLWLRTADRPERMPVLPFLFSIAEKFLPQHRLTNSTALSRRVFALLLLLLLLLCPMARIFLGAVLL